MSPTENENQSEILAKRKVQPRPVSKSSSNGRGDNAEPFKTNFKDTAKDNSKDVAAKNGSETQSASSNSEESIQKQPSKELATVQDQSTWIKDVSQTATDLDQSVRSFLRRRPMESAAAAVGIGFLGSLLIKKFTAQRSHS